MLPLGSPVAQLVFDDSVNIERRLFAVAVFFNSEAVGREFGRPPEDHPLDSLDLLQELSSKRPDFKERENGIRAVYEIAVRGVGAYLQTTTNLNRQASQIDQYLKAATVKAQLGPAAARWKSKARWHRFGAIVGISPFLMILMPPVFYADEIARFVKSLWIMDDQTKSSILVWSQVLKDAPIAMTAIVTVPALMLAWILKHFSRMFVQNLNLSADAGNRAAISDVYARMIAQGSSFSPETQKIVIENLFGTKPSGQDEISHGPIDQFLEAIKSKQSS